jgi:NRPS condensation-like uncharacterized protein
MILYIPFPRKINYHTSFRIIKLCCFRKLESATGFIKFHDVHNQCHGTHEAITVVSHVYCLSLRKQTNYFKFSMQLETLCSC